MSVTKPTIGQSAWGSTLNAALDSLDGRIDDLATANTALASDWLPSTGYVTGQLLYNDGSLYRVSADHTSPSVFDGVNLTEISGVSALIGLSGARKTGDVTLSYADLSDGSSLRSSTQITDEINTAFAAATVADLAIDTVSGTRYVYVGTDRGRGKRFLDDTASTVTAIIPSDADLLAADPDHLIGVGGVLIARQWGSSQVTFAPRSWQKVYSATNFYNAAAQNSYSVTLPAAGSGTAQLQDHDSYLVAIALPVASNRTWSGMPTGFAQVDMVEDLPSDLPAAMFGTSAGVQVAVFEKLDIVASTDGGQTLTFTHTGSNVQGAIALIGIRDGIRTGSMVDVVAATTTNTKVAPGLTTATANATRIEIVANASGNTTADTAYTAPSGMTIGAEAHTTNNGGAAPNVSVAIGFGASWTPSTGLLGVGPSGTVIPTGTWTTTGGANVGAAATLSVKPRTGMSVTLRAAGGAYFKTAEQYALITAEKVAADTYVIDGYAAI